MLMRASSGLLLLVYTDAWTDAQPCTPCQLRRLIKQKSVKGECTRMLSCLTHHDNAARRRERLRVKLRAGQAYRFQSKRLANQSLAQVPASKRGEVLLM